MAKDLSLEEWEKLVPNPTGLDQTLFNLLQEGAIFAYLGNAGEIRYRYNPKYKIPCIYASNCRKYPDCPAGRGDAFKDYSCLVFKGDPSVKTEKEGE